MSQKKYYYVTTKTKTEMPISFYTAGKIVQGIYIPVNKSNPCKEEEKKEIQISHFIIEGLRNSNHVQISDFLIQKKALDIIQCNISEIDPLHYQSSENYYRKISLFHLGKQKITVKIDENQKIEYRQKHDFSLHSIMAQKIDNETLANIQTKTRMREIMSMTIKEIHEHKSALAMCLAVDQIIMQYNMNILPCCEKNIKMIKREIQTGNFKVMTFNDTTHAVSNAIEKNTCVQKIIVTKREKKPTITERRKSI